MNWRKTTHVLMAVVCLGGGGVALASGPSQSWGGRVTYVTDGDTLWVQPTRGGKPRKIRLDGVDAPEICQAYGAAARGRLVQQVMGRSVRVVPRRHDDYGRLLARVDLQGQDVGGWMVLNGHAWSHRYRRLPGLYAPQEARARGQHLGLWQFPAVTPRRFRQRHGPCH